MTWHNLPCPETLPSVSQACPDGWLEVYIEHHAPRSNGADYPQDGDTGIHLARVWGVDCDGIAAIKDLLDDLYDDEQICRVPDKATALYRLVRRPARTQRIIMGDADFVTLAPVEFTLDCFWGVDGKPVYTLDAHPSLTGQQAAPQPGRGDMWQQVLDRYQAQLHPAVLELFSQRRELGIAKYGVPLQANNGRSIFKDLVQETLDRIAYAEQAATERPELAEVMLGIQEHDIATLGGLIMVYGRTAPDGEPLP
jgi:hypothetical protein